MRRVLVVVLALQFVIPAPAWACLWDRDTPRDEARGLHDAVAAITGRFPRNPPLFYEMRLARVSKQLDGHPDDLAAYDDAGVACDRLGRGDEAIAWMGRKREQLDKQDGTRPEVRDHWYRYHANLGTFWAHRWIRSGADRSRIEEMKTARDHIARALEINPDAHFGREKYQLRAMDWIIDPPAQSPALGYHIPNLLGWSPYPSDESKVQPDEAEAAVHGLAGLVVLGDAWESVDVFHALAVALMRDTVGFSGGESAGRGSLAFLAGERCRELIDAGRGSLWPGAPRGEDLERKILEPQFVDRDDLLRDEYRKLRAEADAWQAHRQAFLLAGLKQGRHPDTDPRFWDGYREAAPPELLGVSASGLADVRERARRNRAVGVVAASLLAVAAGTAAVSAKLWSRRKSRPTEG